MRKRVSYIFPVSHHFRYPFHLKLRDILANQGVEYTVNYCSPFGENLAKQDTVDIAWGKRSALLRFGRSAQLQCALGEVLRSDLTILQQENRLLLNYPSQLLSQLGLRKVAFFGHGRNFQAEAPNSRSERWKRFWATKVDWWFGYTEETKRVIADLGFPPDRITVVNNAVDTSELSNLAEGISLADLEQLRSQLNLQGENIGIYVGGLYAEKRLNFLIEALDLIRNRVPNFEFIVVGGGPEFPLLQTAATTRPWLKVVGPKFGKEKVALMRLGALFLIPGLVGLAILDAGVVGLPVITTDYPYHSPEIAYLEEWRNGLIVRPWEDVNAYANAVVDLLTVSQERRKTMSAEAQKIARNYSIDAMAANFASGILSALKL